MRKPFDEAQRKALLGVFADRASNAVEFTRTAEDGGFRSQNQGLKNLLPTRITPEGKRAALKSAILKFLAGGGQPYVKQETGDVEMQLDPATFYQFRLQCCGVRLFVKVRLFDEILTIRRPW